MKKNTPAPQSVEVRTLDLLVELLPTLKALKVTELVVDVNPPRAQLDWDEVAKAALAVGADANVEYHPSDMGAYFTADFTYKGMRFCGGISKEYVEPLGCHLVDGKPVRTSA